jgi:hypothetical protein
MLKRRMKGASVRVPDGSSRLAYTKFSLGVGYFTSPGERRLPEFIAKLRLFYHEPSGHIHVWHASPA